MERCPARPTGRWDARTYGHLGERLCAGTRLGQCDDRFPPDTAARRPARWCDDSNLAGGDERSNSAGGDNANRRYEVHGLSEDVLTAVRSSGLDVSGNPVHQLLAGGGEQLRCCLALATQGERIILFGYEPPLPPSPYREIGAVFAHAEPCEGPMGTSYPLDWYGKTQILRAYDRRGWIHPSSCVHDGSDPEAAIMAILADAEVAWIHSRNVAYGCFAFAITRGSV